MPAGVAEGFAVETHDGLVFTVKGLVQPPDRIVAYLRYVPDPSGDRERGGVCYRRVYRFGEQVEALRARGLEYLVDEPAFGVRLQAVPTVDVRVVHDPCVRLAELAEDGPRLELERVSLEFADLVAGAAGVPMEALGLTGSLLVGLQNAASDIDVVVYGEAACRAVHAALVRLVAEPGAQVRRPGRTEVAAIHARHRADTPLSDEDFARLQARKVNEGSYAGRAYFLRFVKRPHETGERYGDPRYRQLGDATIRGRVVGDSDALFTPCRYLVDEVAVQEGPPVTDVREIVSFRGRFADQARRGEWVVARGALEEVAPQGSPAWRRLLVGGTPGDLLVSTPD